MDTFNSFMNQTSAFLNPNPQFAFAGGPSFNTQFINNGATKTPTRATTNSNKNNDSSFDLNIGTNTDKVTGRQARSLEAKLNDNLAGAGRSVSSGDRFLVMARKGKYADASLYQPGQADQLNQNSPDIDTKRILQAEAVGYNGENISFRDVTQDVLAQEKMERGAADGENVAAVAGDGEGDVEYSTTSITKATPQDISRFNFNKYLRDLIGPPPADMVDPHAHHIFYKIGLGIKQKTLVKEGHAILRRYGIDPIFGKENLIWATNRVIGQHGIDDLELMVTRLREVEKFGGDYDDIVMILREFGRRAALRRK